MRRIASVLTLAATLALAWLLLDVLLLFFAGLLLAVFLHALGALVERHSPLSRHWALTAAIALLVSVLPAAATLSSQRVAQQAMRLTEEMSRATKQARATLEEQPWGRWLLLDRAPSPDTLLASRQRVMSATTSVLSGTLGAVTTFAVILFLGLYLAIQSSATTPRKTTRPKGTPAARARITPALVNEPLDAAGSDLGRVARTGRSAASDDGRAAQRSRPRGGRDRVAAPRELPSTRLALVVRSTTAAVVAGVAAVLWLTGTHEQDRARDRGSPRR